MTPKILPSTLPDSICPLFSIAECSHIALGTQTLKTSFILFALFYGADEAAQTCLYIHLQNVGELELYVQLAGSLWGKMERWCCTSQINQISDGTAKDYGMNLLSFFCASVSHL